MPLDKTEREAQSNLIAQNVHHQSSEHSLVNELILRAAKEMSEQDWPGLPGAQSLEENTVQEEIMVTKVRRLCDTITTQGRWEELERAAIAIVSAGGISAMRWYRDAADWHSSPGSSSGDPAIDELLSEYTKQQKNPPIRADLEATVTILRNADSMLSPIADSLACGLSYFGEEIVISAYRHWLTTVLGNNISRKIRNGEQFFSGEQNLLRVILDGIDGTANFYRGIPLFCSAMGILIDDQARVSALYDPIHNVVYSAILPGPYEEPTRGASASAWEVGTGNRINLVELAQRREAQQLNREAIAIHLTRSSESALHEFVGNLEALASASGAVYALNTGIPAMAHVAKGGLGAFLNNYINLWDVAAGEVLVKACGGAVTNFEGEEIRYNSESRVSVIAAKAHLHSQLLKILQGDSPEDH